MKSKPPKIILLRETLLKLEPHELQQLAGGRTVPHTVRVFSNCIAC
jgi:hypothetical protein